MSRRHYRDDDSDDDFGTVTLSSTGRMAQTRLSLRRGQTDPTRTHVDQTYESDPYNGHFHQHRQHVRNPTQDSHAGSHDSHHGYGSTSQRGYRHVPTQDDYAGFHNPQQRHVFTSQRDYAEHRHPPTNPDPFGRIQVHPSQLPRTPARLREFVRTYGSQIMCTCDRCHPELYANCTHGPHPTINYMSPSLARRNGYEALHISNQAIISFDKSEHSLTYNQRFALQQLRTAIGHGCAALNAPDGRAIDPRLMVSIVQHLQVLFFFGVTPITFRWSAMSDRGGQTQLLQSGCMIELPPDFIVPSVLRMNPVPAYPMGVSRFATLMHESIHAFLMYWACRQCPTIRWNVGEPQQHGRTFQILAAAMERRAYRWFGVEFPFGRFNALLCHMAQNNGQEEGMVSRCDLRYYEPWHSTEEEH
ncbi:hypothetical protein B0J11DRAFT_505918 [Dendryphion nanum]|uniref:SprT-like domain-containing protein n=1 Tax=Dendryphion nanum TaxID=256645 RepID=A0A9P9DYA1_9PLEO|nr:hypothetical protein B0J11DRAFT_505918 [Dendryphion nanum]